MPTTTTNPRSSYRPNWVKIPKIPQQTYTNRNAARKAWNRANPDNRIKSPRPINANPVPPTNPDPSSPATGGVGQLIRWAMGGSVATFAKAIPGAVALVLLDPFTQTADGTPGAAQKRHQDLMPPEPPQKIQEEKYQFTGGQEDGILYGATIELQYPNNPNGSSVPFTAWGPISGFVVITEGNRKNIYCNCRGINIGRIEPIQPVGFYVVTGATFFPDVPSSILSGFRFLVPLHRIDGQPDTSGNSPPIVQPIYTTNITNNYTINPPPLVGGKSPPAPSKPPIIIMPIGGGASPSIASVPPPQIIIPQLKPDTSPSISPLPTTSSPSETSPNTAQSPPPASYPLVQTVPSTGITAAQAEASRTSGVQVTPSTGVKPEAKPVVEPVPEQGQKPTVDNNDRLPTFSRPAPPSIDWEWLTQELLQIEQSLIQHRVSINNLDPDSTAQSISRQIQQEEQRLTRLRGNTSAARQTIVRELEQAEQAIKRERSRFNSLDPSAAAEIEKNNLEQTRQRIIRLRNRLNNETEPTNTTQTQTQTQPSPQPQTQPQTQPTNEQLQNQLTNLGLGLALLTPLVNPINQAATQTTPEALRNAAASGICSTLKPGGCMSGLANNAATAASNSASNQGLLNRILNILRGANETLLPFIWQRVQTIDTKLGPQLNGGIGGFMQTAFRAMRIDKVINALILVTVLHNAALLSRNLLSTLGDLTGQALSVIGIKDEEGSPIDINEILNQQVNSLFETILGKEVWAGTKTAWNKANTIISTTTQIMSTVRSLWDSSREVLEWTAENTGKIGNALKKFRVVGENAYKWMPERVTHQNAWYLKVQRFRDKTDSLDDAASSLSGVLGEVQNIQSEFKELNEQKERFDKSIADLTPKDRAENKPVADAVKASRDASKAPSDAADVFRGAGE